MFPDTAQRVYLITVFQSFQDDGEAYSSSTAFTLKDQAKESNKIIWVNQLAHELLHYWLGGELQMNGGAASRWFHEGFTEYFANLSLIRNGGLYLLFKWSYPDTSLFVAGENRGSMFRFGVYNGGWVIAFSLDMKLRAASHGSKRLDEVLGLLYRKYKGVSFTHHDLVSSLNATAQGDYEEFMGKYVTGKETVPIKKFLPEAGLYGCYVDYQGEFYLQPAPGIESTKLLDAWIGGSEGR
jgi:predicted metalloprotease with PDZ domain